MDLRDLIANTLGVHRLGWRGSGRVNCECGWSFTYGRRPNDASAEHARHVADVLLAALGERPDYAAGVAAGRAQAAADIRAHMDKHAPADGNYAQIRLRTHLGIAERVALGPMTHAEVAQALNEMFANRTPKE